ncbi:MAG TPA: DUF2273 domain-containing protein [bacterium]|mgnify:CR=1 FL=1|nr:DUF2273 domain-containing protein [bacterium]
METFNKHKAKIILTILFLFLGILIMTIGFLKTIFVVMLGLVGLGLGRIIDDRDLVRKFINNYLGK